MGLDKGRMYFSLIRMTRKCFNRRTTLGTDDWAPEADNIAYRMNGKKRWFYDAKDEGRYEHWN